jgi:hypothetical protein
MTRIIYLEMQAFCSIGFLDKEFDLLINFNQWMWFKRQVNVMLFVQKKSLIYVLKPHTLGT